MIKLIEPTLEYINQIKTYRKEFLDNGDSMDGTEGLREYENPEEWINKLSLYKNPLTVPKDKVQATQYILVREEDQKIIGMIDIRHYFNEYLERYGGNIGYSIAPSERQKGYATLMLKMTLPKCREIGLNKVLITCYNTNEGSRKTIINNGGIYESTVLDPDTGKSLERYWILLNE